MIRKHLTSLAISGALLAGCASKEELTPPPGQTLPPAPYGAQYRPSADDLLALPIYAAPERNIELREKSEPREDDPFDLPPS